MIEYPEIDQMMISDPAARKQRERWLRDMALCARDALASGTHIQEWVRGFQLVRSSILRQVWEATIPEPIRKRTVYVRFGSSGRGEDLLTSDLDHGVIADSEETVLQLRPYLAQFIDRMNEFGCPVCQGFVMSTNPRWIGTVDGWRDRLEGYFQFPDWENVRYLFIAVDGQPLNGEIDVWQPIHDRVFQGISQSPFICWEMAHLGIHKSVALGWFRRVRTATGTIAEAVHLKDGLITPILHSVRLLAIANGLSVNSTWERLHFIERNRLLPAELATRCRETLVAMLTLRLQKQVSDVLAGREPSDVVGIGESTSEHVRVNRDALVRHLEVAKQLERFVHRHFRKPR